MTFTDDLPVYLMAIEKTAGSRWLHDQVQLIRSADPRLEIGASPDRSGIHPLASAWLRAREEFMSYEITGRAAFSEETCLIAGLGRDLNQVAGLNGYPAQKNRLLEQSLFNTASYEISIAAGYIRQGYRVEFTSSGLELRQNGSAVRAGCFAAAGEKDPAKLFAFLEKEVSTSDYPGPALAYFEIDSRNRFLEDFLDRYREKLGVLFHPRTPYYALVITSGRETLPGCRAGRPGGVAVVNPHPGSELPPGFRIYSPAGASSMS